MKLFGYETRFVAIVDGREVDLSSAVDTHREFPQVLIDGGTVARLVEAAKRDERCRGCCRWCRAQSRS